MVPSTRRAALKARRIFSITIATRPSCRSSARCVTRRPAATWTLPTPRTRCAAARSEAAQSAPTP
ncbi:hypothetical protein BE08_37600 [Sorangium cellulosum]|uniref:Uncharacterized protein n=1 Tax=Sorangium cellulosum TaxID=56 RepID=A0A150P7Z5_SORCE|nr:hypothetical protein BE08_37600 [Sorangium cellulosum]